MKSLLTWLSRRRFPYEPLIQVEINSSKLIHNLDQFKKIAPNKHIAPVLKSNAYGHGLFEVAHILRIDDDSRTKADKIPFCIVDSYFEAIALRSKGFRLPLLIIGYTRPEILMHSRLSHVAFTITTIETLHAIVDVRHHVHIHLKIDTGMHRQGILPEELDDALDLIERNPLMIVDGVCSHLSDADNSDPSFTESQIKLWNSLVNKIKEKNPLMEYVHLSNTDGHRYSNDIVANVSRLGIGLYGLVDGNKFHPALNLKPVLEMKTIVSGVKKLSRDQSIGYGASFKTEKEMIVATIPVGYHEGVDRRLSNRGWVLVGDDQVPCPIVGRVSMNITIVDISHTSNVQVGTPVVVMSARLEEPNSIINIAKTCDTISHEIAVKIPGNLRRVVV